jgi:hypothetical protein
LNGLRLFFMLSHKKKRCNAKARGRWSAKSAKSYSWR